ncbi:hypothetical protein KM043_013528 [Ampulex compressa]|nr:hypothetical protein KM043_013528 [Ampulex compressa]
MRRCEPTAGYRTLNCIGRRSDGPEIRGSLRDLKEKTIQAYAHVPALRLDYRATVCARETDRGKTTGPDNLEDLDQDIEPCPERCDLPDSHEAGN